MSFMVFIDDYAAWSADSLHGAQELANGYVRGGQPLKIVDYARFGGGRTWVYDYDRSTWLEHGASAADGN